MAVPNLRNFRHRRGTLELGQRTRLMGILNVTPDSFSDGGEFLSAERAIEHALKLAHDGAEIIDIGAESTRPGSAGTPDDLQLERLLPVLTKIRTQTDALISIDTRSAVVARECLTIGADMINDVSGLSHDPSLAVVCAEHKAGLILMHMRGTPATMQTELGYDNLIREVCDFLAEAVSQAISAGVAQNAIVVDPGLGFGKSFEQNYLLMGSLSKFSEIGVGVLVGPSRKGFTGEFSKLAAADRQYSTAATVAISILNGADILRVHDVAEMRQVADICDRYRDIMHEQLR